VTQRGVGTGVPIGGSNATSWTLQPRRLPQPTGAKTRGAGAYLVSDYGRHCEARGWWLAAASAVEHACRCMCWFCGLGRSGDARPADSLARHHELGSAGPPRAWN